MKHYFFRMIAILAGTRCRFYSRLFINQQLPDFRAVKRPDRLASKFMGYPGISCHIITLKRLISSDDDFQDGNEPNSVFDEDFNFDSFDDAADPNESYPYKFRWVNVEQNRLNDLLKHVYNVSSKKARDIIDEKKLLRNSLLVTKKTEKFNENDQIGEFVH